jgi:uncharacterized protein with HEPN domain
LSFEEFVGDETLKRTDVRIREAIGEATMKISADYKVRWS